MLSQEAHSTEGEHGNADKSDDRASNCPHDREEPSEPRFVPACPRHRNEACLEFVCALLLDPLASPGRTPHGEKEDAEAEEHQTDDEHRGGYKGHWPGGICDHAEIVT